MKWITNVDITPTTFAAWTTINLSAYIPTTASGVIVKFNNKHFGTANVAWRKTGSTYNNVQLTHPMLSWFICGTTNACIDVNIHSAYKLYLVGYFEEGEAVFFDTPTNLNALTNSTWQTHDITSYTGGQTTYGAIVEVYGTISSYNLRKYGSNIAETVISTNYSIHNSSIVATSNNKFESYLTNSSLKLYISGIIKTDKIVFLDNLQQLSYSATGWNNVTLPENATGGFIEGFLTSANNNYSARKLGETGAGKDDISKMGYHNIAFSECDTNRVLQINSSILNTLFYLKAYTVEGTTPPVTNSEITVGTSNISANSFSASIQTYIPKPTLTLEQVASGVRLTWV